MSKIKKLKKTIKNLRKLAPHLIGKDIRNKWYFYNENISSSRDQWEGVIGCALGHSTTHEDMPFLPKFSEIDGGSFFHTDEMVGYGMEYFPSLYKNDGYGYYGNKHCDKVFGSYLSDNDKEASQRCLDLADKLEKKLCKKMSDIDVGDWAHQSISGNPTRPVNKDQSEGRADRGLTMQHCEDVMRKGILIGVDKAKDGIRKRFEFNAWNNVYKAVYDGHVTKVSASPDELLKYYNEL